jgi:chromosome segregation ATPase
MSGDPLYDLHGLTDRLDAVLSTQTRHATLRDRLRKELVSKETEVETLTYEVEVLTKVVELFRMLLDQLVEKQVKTVEKIGTEGLQTVFPDLDLSLESEVDPKYNKISVDFFFRKGTAGHPASYRGRPLDAFGGGPSSVVSLILRVLTIKKLRLAPLLILDESLAAVSDEYIDLTGQFIRALAEKLEFDIVLVTHKPAFLEHAHASYRCSEEVESDGISTYVVLKKAS